MNPLWMAYGVTAHTAAADGHTELFRGTWPGTFRAAPARLGPGSLRPLQSKALTQRP